MSQRLQLFDAVIRSERILLCKVVDNQRQCHSGAQNKNMIPYLEKLVRLLETNESLTNRRESTGTGLIAVSARPRKY